MARSFSGCVLPALAGSVEAACRECGSRPPDLRLEAVRAGPRADTVRTGRRWGCSAPSPTPQRQRPGPPPRRPSPRGGRHADTLHSASHSVATARRLSGFDGCTPRTGSAGHARGGGRRPGRRDGGNAEWTPSFLWRFWLWVRTVFSETKSRREISDCGNLDQEVQHVELPLVSCASRPFASVVLAEDAVESPVKSGATSQLTLRCPVDRLDELADRADLSTNPDTLLQCASREIVVLVSHEQHHGRPRGHVVHGLEDTHADSRVGFGVEYHDIGRTCREGSSQHATWWRTRRPACRPHSRGTHGATHTTPADGQRCDGFFDHLTHSEEPGITSSPG